VTNSPSLRGAAQAEASDFRRASEAKRQNDLANATIDVDLRFAEPIPALDKALTEARASVKAAEDRQSYLSTVSMAGKNEVNPIVGGITNSKRVVAEQNLGLAGGHTREGTAKIVRLPPEIIHPDEPQAVPRRVKRVMTVAQDDDSFCLQCARYRRRVYLKIVVS
jgi:hypothetical protein